MVLFKGAKTSLKFNLGITPKNTKQHIYANLTIIQNNLNLTINDLKKGFKVPLVYGSPFMRAVNELIKLNDKIEGKNKNKFEMYVQDIIVFVRKQKTLESDISFYKKIKEIKKWVLKNI